jgi:DNA-binding transcriptional MerR regulator
VLGDVTPIKMAPMSMVVGFRRGRRNKKRRPPGYVRPSRAKPKTGWTVQHLASLVGVAPTTIRLYVKSGVVPHPAFKGSATRYERSHLLRLAAARRMMQTGKWTLAGVYTELQKASAAQLESFVIEGSPSQALATALGIALAPQGVGSASAKVAGQVIAGGIPRWAHLELALGIELHVRDDASPQARDLARRIRDLAATAGDWI